MATQLDSPDDRSHPLVILLARIFPEVPSSDPKPLIERGCMREPKEAEAS